MTIENGRDFRPARWALAAACLGLAALLALTLETGRARAQASAFRFLGALTNIVTPNGDGRNDVAIFCFDNPRASAVSGTIYDLRGHRVSAMGYVQSNANCQSSALTVEKLVWDGKSDGTVVAPGAYIYQIQSEDATVTGTVIVAR